MTEWKLSQLTVDGKGSYGIGAPAVPLNPSLYTYLRITDIADDGTLQREGRASVDDPDAINYLLKENDIVFARTGNSTGRAYFYEPSEGDLVYAGFLIKFSLDPEKVNPRILKYYTHSKPYYDWVHSSDTGATRGNINAKTLGDMPVVLPDRSTQDRIVDILSSFDARIENNNRINRNLEEQAQALFKSWFVDFDPWGGVMPKDWKEDRLGSLCKCVLGGTPSRNRPEFWNGDVAWINSGEVNRFRITSPSEWITKLGLEKSATKLLPAKTVVLAITGATLGQISILEIDSCANQSVIGILQNEQMPYEFIYPLMNEKIHELVLHQTGGAQQHINKDNVESLKFFVPDSATMKHFQELISPMYATIANKEFENRHLSELRDTLLPKLMSGEIEL